VPRRLVHWHRTLAHNPLLSAVAVVVPTPTQSNPLGSFSSQYASPPAPPRSEDARRYFRTVYDFPQWQKHRDQYRLLRRLFTIPQ
jgi:hypothetical protein